MKPKSDEKTVHRPTNGTRSKQTRVCRNWPKEKIDSAIESLKANNYTLKYTSIKTGIPQDILKQHADLKNIKYKDIEATDEVSSDSDDETEKNDDGNETDISGGEDSNQSSEYEEQQVLIDPPRTTTARKSTSPLKFFMKSFKITSNQRNFSSSLSTSSKSSETSSIIPFATIRVPKQKQPTKQITPNINESIDTKLIPHTNKVIDYVLIGPNQNFNQADIHNYLQNKTKIIEEIEKTVKIYSFLGLRHKYHPLFLNRTLSYMSNHKKTKKSTKKQPEPINGYRKKKIDFKKNRLESKVQELHSKLNLKQSTIENQTKSYELKINFNYFQINNNTFVSEQLNEPTDFKSNHKKKKANVEIYGIFNNKSTLIGKSKCEIKTENKTFVTFGNNSKLNLKIKQSSYSYYLIRVYFKQSLTNQQQTQQQPAQQPDFLNKNEEAKNTNPKKRKLGGVLRRVSTVSKKNRPNIFQKKENNPQFNDSNKQHDFYLICTFGFDQNEPPKPSSVPTQLSEFFKRTTDLKLDKNDEFILETKHLIYSKDKTNLKKSLNINFGQPNSDDTDEENDDYEDTETNEASNIPENDSSRKIYKKRSVYTKKAKADTKSDVLDALLDDFYCKKDTFLISLSIETTVVIEPIIIPISNQRSSPRSKLAPKPLHIIPDGSNSDDDIIIISPPTSPVAKKRQSFKANETNSLNTTKNEANDKRSTRSTKTDSMEINGNKFKIPNNIHIFYQFIKNETNKIEITSNNKIKSSKSAPNSTNNRLLTQKFDLICPFCYLDCKQLNFLCFHFQMFHFRFQIEEQTINGFTNGHTNISQAICNNNYLACTSQDYSDDSKMKKVQFNIRLDENFNGSYLGNPYDIHYAAHLGFSLSRVKPSKRNQVSFVLVNKKSNIFDLNQFKDLTQEEFSVLNIIQQQQQQLNCQMQPNNLYNCQAGIERLYYHTQTGQPINVDELEHDSDNELDPDWLKEQTNLLIDDFDDVNEGEKDMMRLWNLHNIKFNYIPDCEFYHLCEKFIIEQTENIMRKNLFNNFTLHLANAVDYGLLSADQMIKLNEYLHERKAELSTQIEITKTPTKSKSLTKYNSSSDKLNNHSNNKK